MKKIYTIGRDEGCDIVIPDSTDVISRLHATIRIESNDKIYLIDQSRNGTYVNGMKMSSNVEIPVSRNDVVSFAHIYNLDWSLVPKVKSNILMISVIASVVVLLLAMVVYFLLADGNSANDNHSDSGVVMDTTEVINEPVEIESEAIEDTIEETSPKETVSETKRADSQEKAQDVNVDSVNVDKKEEEVYNPIY